MKAGIYIRSAEDGEVERLKLDLLDKPDSFPIYYLVWNQKDIDGEQVSPGEYEIISGDNTTTFTILPIRSTWTAGASGVVFGLVLVAEYTRRE